LGTACDTGTAGAAPTEVRVALRPVPASAGTARRFVVATLRDWDLEELVDTAALLVSELVTNAILHARSDVTVAVRALDDRVRVEVVDEADGVPLLRHATDTATTGRGLALVDACAWSWGVEPHPPGKAVWFDLEA
jgi:anti-sigma regulatory factor (Ser/Thr protein kinase)